MLTPEISGTNLCTRIPGEGCKSSASSENYLFRMSPSCIDHIDKHVVYQRIYHIPTLAGF